MRNFVGRRTLQRIFACEQLFVTFVMSGFAAHIGIIPQSLVSDGQKTKTRLVPPRALCPDRNFATWAHLPRLGSAPLIGFLANIHRKIGSKTLIWQICCEQDAYCILSTLIFHRIVENAVDYRARIYVSLYSFMPCSSLNHDRSTGLYLSVINCDTLMHRQMPRS